MRMGTGTDQIESLSSRQHLTTNIVTMTDDMVSSHHTFGKNKNWVWSKPLTIRFESGFKLSLNITSIIQACFISNYAYYYFIR